jgi:dihydropyrimidinase
MSQSDTLTFDAAIVGGRVVVPGEGISELTVGIRGETIAALLDPGVPVSASETIDASGRFVLPGVIDPHTHIGYEGYRGIPLDALPSHFETETASALVGGVTTLLCTYRNAPSYEEIWDEMREAGESHSRIDFGYSLGITNDEQLAHISDYHRELGVTSFKFYMAYRGEEASATGNVYNTYDDGLLYEGMEAISEIPGGMAMVHAENIEIIARLRRRLRSAGRNDLAAWSESRPDFTEAENVRRALYLGERTGCAVYIPHLTCRASLDAVREHRARGTTIAHVETCSQYLTHTADSPVGLLGKVNPPLRSADDREALWEGIRGGDIDCVATDHCGVRREAKGPDIWTAVPGFPGMATLLPALLDGAARGVVSLERVAELTSLRAAKLFNLYPRKGTIAVGSDADLVIVDADLRRTVTHEELRSRSDFSIYEGWELTGWPVLVIGRGRVLMRRGEILAEPGRGRYLERFADDKRQGVRG